MWHELSFPSLLAALTAIIGLFVVSGAWLYLVMRRTRAARISLRAFGVSVEVDMTKERRGENVVSKHDPS